MSVKCVLRCFAVGSVSLAFGAVDPLDALVGIFEHAPVTLQAPDRTSQAAGAIVQRLGAQGPGVSPHAGAALDPDSHHARAACDKDFSQQCDLVTIEFENIPIASIEFIEKFTNCYPASNIVKISQNRK